MSDLLSLVCPSCSGKLNVSPNATSLKCQHCGNEHMVKHEAGAVMLETYARCPQCGRNDKSEKVTAVIASQTQEISGTEQKTEVFTNAQGQQQTVVRDVPYTRKQVSIPGKNLAAPAEPEYPPLPSQPDMGNPSAGWGTLLIFGGLTGLIGILCWTISSVSPLLDYWNYGSIPQNVLMNILMSAVLGCGLSLVSIALVALGVILIVRENRSKKAKQSAFRQEVEEANLERQRIRQAWDHATQRWHQLYYCARDDCVFIPGEGASAPVAQLKVYLYRQ